MPAVSEDMKISLAGVQNWKGCVVFPFSCMEGKQSLLGNCVLVAPFPFYFVLGVGQNIAFVYQRDGTAVPEAGK